MILEGTGLNRLLCRRAGISALVASYWMALQARFYGLLIVRSGGSDFGARGIVQRPLVQLCWNVMIMFMSLNNLKFYLQKISAQSSSRSCRIYMREPVLRLLRA